MFSLKIRTLNKSKELLFICIGKWANDELKNRSLLVQPAVLRRGEPEGCLLLLPSFAVANNVFVVANLFVEANPKPVFLDLSLVVLKHSFVVANLFAAASKTATDQQLPLYLISSITLLDFHSNPAKHK